MFEVKTCFKESFRNCCTFYMLFSDFLPQVCVDIELFTFVLFQTLKSLNCEELILKTGIQKATFQCKNVTYSTYT